MAKDTGTATNLADLTQADIEYMTENGHRFQFATARVRFGADYAGISVSTVCTGKFEQGNLCGVAVWPTVVSSTLGTYGPYICSYDPTTEKLHLYNIPAHDTNNVLTEVTGTQGAGTVDGGDDDYIRVNVFAFGY